ncbi:hypothetical protein [Schaalia sp. ZJ1691]|uniref:hypothetical protein n=1 Tax=Schaalia sp. ZJ1691 TaxID=2709404 RepID=UPI0013E9FEA8|nr:hypothetical protein [Schaalia sp. ZJ1691]
MAPSIETKRTARRRSRATILTIALTSALLGSQLAPAFAGDEPAAETSAPASATENPASAPDTESASDTQPTSDAQPTTNPAPEAGTEREAASPSAMTSPANAAAEAPAGNLITDQHITQGDTEVTETSLKIAITAKSGGIYRVEYYGQSYPLTETPRGNGTSQYSVSADGLPSRTVAPVTLYFKATQDGAESSSVIDSYITVLNKLINKRGSLPVLPTVYSGQVSDTDRTQIINNVITWYRAAGYEVAEGNITTDERGVTVRVDTVPVPQGWDRHQSVLLFRWPIFYSVRPTTLTVTNRGIGSDVTAPGQGSVAVSYDGRTFVKDRKSPVYSSSKNARYIMSVTSDDLKPWAEPFSGDNADRTVTIAYTGENGQTETRAINLTSSQLWFQAVGAALAKNPLPKVKVDCTTNDDGEMVCPKPELTTEKLEEYKTLIAQRLNDAGIPYTDIRSYGNNYPLFINLPTETIDGTTVYHRYYLDDLVEMNKPAPTDTPSTDTEDQEEPSAGTDTEDEKEPPAGTDTEDQEAPSVEDEAKDQSAAGEKPASDKKPVSDKKPAAGKKAAQTLAMTGSPASGHMTIVAGALIVGAALMLTRRRAVR